MDVKAFSYVLIIHRKARKMYETIHTSSTSFDPLRGTSLDGSRQCSTCFVVVQMNRSSEIPPWVSKDVVEVCMFSYIYLSRLLSTKV